jgi:hypothetical protein
MALLKRDEDGSRSVKKQESVAPAYLAISLLHFCQGLQASAQMRQLVVADWHARAHQSTARHHPSGYGAVFWIATCTSPSKATSIILSLRNHRRLSTLRLLADFTLRREPSAA